MVDTDPPAEAQQDKPNAAVVALADALAMAADADGDLDPAELLSWINEGGWYLGRQPGAGWVTVRIPAEDFDMLTTYDPERERSASRRNLVDLLADVGQLLREGRQ